MPTDSGIQLPEKSDRLNRLLEIAMDYRGWSRKELAEALGRDIKNILPQSSNPKMDYIFKLAEILDWDVGDVAEILFGDDDDESVDHYHTMDGEARDGKAKFTDPLSSMDYKQADDASRQAWIDGEYKRSIRFARQAIRVAKSAEQRANGHLGEALAWETLGRYTKSLEALRRALREKPVSPLLRRNIQSNLSNIYYSLWHLDEARALSGELIHHFSNNPPDNVYDRSTLAYVNYIHGHVLRRSMSSNEVEASLELAEKGIGHLQFSVEAYEALRKECYHPSQDGLLHCCKSGLIELDVLAGHTSPEEAVSTILSGLDSIVDLDEVQSDSMLEGFGWWCVFGCNIALRSLTGQRLHRVMAILTGKGGDIADHLDNWAMRERIVTMEYARRQRLMDLSGVDTEWVLHQDDVRSISGTMGRFPAFRPVGWSILEKASVIRDRN